jgi:fructose transport system ATP-binding protein
VIGDNGAGKSTLIKAISGAVIPDEGRSSSTASRPVLLAHRGARERDRDGLPAARHVPALSIADNMFMGREIRKPGIMGSGVPPARPARDGENSHATS